ncbi:hypothetical protein [Bacillus sp. Marseille-P3661]|uniref:hypothetical protein n=1 Tax=Bacillus sp. Marseille-P3661 TaxID=1936234 RepID=UPI000C820584|nr:hypothetical protein [Bacillus sp. Marseille-P3661]
MIGLLTAILIFNLLAFKTNTTLSRTQIAHIWAFTLAFQNLFDIFVDIKYTGYWYFTKDIDWGGLLAHTVLLPPVNMMFINWYPFKSSYWKQAGYIAIWVIIILIYETIALLPEPWGYFHYGWWTIWHSVILNPILFFILVTYYKRFIRGKRMESRNSAVRA